jgi:DNA-binding NarL/FixJ family response regulator
LAQDELAAARRWGAPSAISFALRAAGIAMGDAGIDFLRESAAVVADSPARYEKARSLTELGAALRRAGHRRDAREPLRQALDAAHRCGAITLARRTRQELLAAGARPRRTALTGLDSLTASQRRVAQLAAEGLANREIAQALFVTLRTVEMHLTHAYSKLGIGSREALPAALREDGAPGDGSLSAAGSAGRGRFSTNKLPLDD